MWLLVPVVIVVVALVVGIKVVNEYQRLVVFRLGNCIGARGPGVQYIVPILERAISVDFLIYQKVIDPMLSIVRVANFAGASQGIATTTLRAVIGDIVLDDVLSRREQIHEDLRRKLDEVTDRCGVK